MYRLARWFFITFTWPIVIGYLISLALLTGYLAGDEVVGYWKAMAFLSLNVVAIWAIDYAIKEKVEHIQRLQRQIDQLQGHTPQEEWNAAEKPTRLS